MHQNRARIALESVLLERQVEDSQSIVLSSRLSHYPSLTGHWVTEPAVAGSVARLPFDSWLAVCSPPLIPTLPLCLGYHLIVFLG